MFVVWTFGFGCLGSGTRGWDVRGPESPDRRFWVGPPNVLFWTSWMSKNGPQTSEPVSIFGRSLFSSSDVWGPFLDVWGWLPPVLYVRDSDVRGKAPNVQKSWMSKNHECQLCQMSKTLNVKNPECSKPWMSKTLNVQNIECPKKPVSKTPNVQNWKYSKKTILQWEDLTALHIEKQKFKFWMSNLEKDEDSNMKSEFGTHTDRFHDWSVHSLKTKKGRTKSIFSSS